MSIAVNPWFEKKILITVKTYPTPSTKYEETVCTAGITEDGEWIRIYPIRYRFLGSDKKYPKFWWIRARIQRNEDKDFRPESYRVDESSIELLEEVDTKDHWRQRNSLILPTTSASMEELKQQYKQSRRSLGIFRPKQITRFVCETDTASVRANPREFQKQVSLFGEMPPKDLEPIPYKFSYEFICDDPRCTGHKYIILDWEIFAAYFHYKHRYGAESATEKIRKKWFDQLCSPKIDTHFIVGTQFPNPTFMILGVYWPPKGIGIQTTLGL